MLRHYTEKNVNWTEGVYTLNEFMTEIQKSAHFRDNQPTVDKWIAQKDRGWMGLNNEARDGESDFVATSRIVRDGWRRGVELMDKVSDKVSAPTPKTVRRYQRWQSTGDDVEMQRIWAGDLDSAWRGTRRGTRHGPQRVRLLVDAIESGGGDATSMRWRGVTALKVSDLLTEAGYSVQVESVISCKDFCGPQHFKLRVIVKEYEQPLDTLSLAATTALPAFFRSLVHAWGVVVSPVIRSGGVGFSVRTPDTGELSDGDSNSSVFMIDRKVNSADKASEVAVSIIEQLDKAGE